jgi:hypothetical protein
VKGVVITSDGHLRNEVVKAALTWWVAMAECVEAVKEQSRGKEVTLMWWRHYSWKGCSGRT